MLHKRREPEKTKFYTLIQNNLNTFLHQRKEEGKPVPEYAQKQFESFLCCGILAHGFLRLECEKCETEHLVAFSCKCRICPSCLARRMSETALHLSKSVIPEVKVRQYVLTFPPPIRLLLARNEEILAKVCLITNKYIQDFIEKQSQRKDFIQTGSILFIQRFGSALNLNPHFHIIFIDGVYELKSTSRLKYYSLPRITNLKLENLLNIIIDKTLAYLIKVGVVTKEEDSLVLADENSLVEYLEPDDLVLEAAVASVQNKIAFGQNKGQPVKRYRIGNWLLPSTTVTIPSELCIRKDGFSLHAQRVVRKEQRERLKDLIQYMIRPPISEERLSILLNGNVKIALKSPWQDGTEAIELSPLEFIEKILAIIPPPHFHEVRYYGLFAAHATHREAIIPKSSSDEEIIHQSFEANGSKKKKYIPWSVLLKKTFAIDILRCPKCGNRMWIAEAVEDPRVIDATLFILGLPVEPPLPDPPRYESTIFDCYTEIDPPFYND